MGVSLVAFPKILEYARLLVTERVEEGDTVIDATCGNGNDTVFLAQLVGEKGIVYGFDIQEEALRNTKAIIEEKNLTERVKIIEDSHENINKYIRTKVKAAMFNLGYLPGSDKKIITQPNTTIKAIDSLLKILSVNGIITQVVYIKHDNGAEAKMIEEYIKTLDQKKYSVLNYSFLNQINYPSYLIAIEKKI